MKEFIGFAAVLVILIGGSIWVHSSAPCGLFSITPQKEIPARCVSHFNK